MAIITEHGKLSDGDLQRWRTHRARANGIASNPAYYSREEIEQHFRDEFMLFAEFIERYELPPTDDSLVIDPNSGKCYVTT